MIQFVHVSKRYGKKEALSDVSLEIEPGEIFGYIGPNGAGKTTSIKILTGLIRDYEGVVKLDGQDVTENRMRAQALLGYLPQDVGFQEWRTVEHALQTFAKLSGVPDSKRSERIQDAVAMVGIEEYYKTRIVHLSGGTVQKLRLAQAIVHDPKILVLDEPMSGLDPASRYQVKEIVHRLASENRVIFFSSHILSDVENLATRIGILHRGRIKQIGTPEELRSAHGLGTLIEIESRDPFDPNAYVVDGVAGFTAENDRTCRLQVSDVGTVDEVMHRVLAAAVKQKLPVRSVRHLKPSLEELYLSLTEEPKPERAPAEAAREEN